MNKVVNLRTPKQPYQHQGNLDDSNFTIQARALINAKVRDYMAHGGNITKLRRKCGNAVKTTQTISKLAYYETTRPTWRTVIAVSEALGIMEELGNMMVAHGKKMSSN